MGSMDRQKARGRTYHISFIMQTFDLGWAMRDKNTIVTLNNMS